MGRAILAIRLTLTLLILIQIVSAEVIPDNPLFSTALPPWLPFIAIAIIVGFSIAGIAYMLSAAFGLIELQAWAKNEVAEMTGSVFLVLILLLALGVVDSLFTAATGTTPVYFSLKFTNDVADKLFSIYKDSVWFSFAMGTLTSAPPQYLSGATASGSAALTIRNKIAGYTPDLEDTGSPAMRAMIFGILLADMQYVPFQVGNIFYERFGTIQGLTLSAATISIFAGMLINFVNAVAIPILVPFGLFLSMFAMTRKMGRTLIAIGIGLYIFLPLSIIMSEQMYNSAYKANTYPTPIDKPSDASTLQTWLLSSFGVKLAMVFAAPIFMPSLSLGSLKYTPACTSGGAFQAASCGIAMPICWPIFTLICSVISQPLINMPQDVDLSMTRYFNVITILELTMLDSALDAHLSIAQMFAPALPIAISTSGMIADLIWPLLQPITPNAPEMAARIATAVVDMPSKIVVFGAYVDLSKALAVKLTDITLNYIPYILQYVLPILLMPIIMLVVIITGIRSISPAIGGEIQILGLSDLV